MPRSRADENRRIRQEALREQLAEQCRLQHIIDLVEKLEAASLTESMTPTQIQAAKAALDTRVKLLGKYLPDLKSQEIEMHADVRQETVVSADPMSPEEWAQGASSGHPSPAPKPH